MATPIIVNPTKPSQVVVNGTQKSGTPITINTDLDYTRVQSMIGEALGDVKIDTTELAKEQTLLEVSKKLNNLNVDVDLSNVAQQGDNPEATNTKILEETLKVSDAQAQIDQLIAIQLQTINSIASRSVKYNEQTGNLTIENVELIIE